MKQRLVLRPFTAADEAAVHQYAADPEVTRFTDWGPNSPADTAAFIESALDPAPGTYPFAIVLAAEETLIGGCELRVADRRGQLGYVLARRWWGQGYATEAAARLLDFGVNELGLRRIEATCDPRNLASARVLTKIGLHQTAFIADHLPVRGGWRDSLLFAFEMA